MIKLGDKVKDSVTGISGIATARTHYMNGCVQYCIEYAVKGEPKTLWVDEQRISRRSTNKSGGPHSAPPGLNTPPC